MADLRKILGVLGFTNVATLLNSGNAVFDGADEDPAAVASRIRAAVLKKLGVDAPVVVKTAQDIAAVIAGNKLGKIASDPSRLLVAVSSEPESLAQLARLAKSDWKGEPVHVGKHAAYVWCPDGSLQSKVGLAMLGGFKDSVTTRNWATFQKIDALLKP